MPHLLFLHHVVIDSLQESADVLYHPCLQRCKLLVNLLVNDFAHDVDDVARLVLL